MIKLKINGQERNWDGDPDLPLLWFLRDEIGLTGTKFGCGQALCGSCTVIVDKQAVRVLHHLGLRRGRPRGHDDRRPSPHRRSRGAEGLAPGQRAAMRLLPGRPDHAGRGPARGKSKALPRSDPRSDVGQYLPLRLLPAHRKRGPSRFDGGLIMNIIANPDKLRGFERPHQDRKNLPSQRSQGPRHRRRPGAGRAGDVAPGVCGLSDRRRKDAARHGGRPARLRRHRVRRNRYHRGASFRNGNRCPHQPAADRGRGDGSRLVARQGRAGAWRRGQIRQSGYRRIAQHAALSDADAPDRRLGARHAGSRGRQTLGRAGRRGQGGQPRGGSCRKRPASRLRRTGCRCGQGTGAERRQPEAEGPEGLPLSRQGSRSASSTFATSPSAPRITAAIPACPA